MADQTEPRVTAERKLSAYDMCHEFPVAASATIYQGAGVAFNASGLLVKASTVGAAIAVGRAAETVVSAVSGQTLRCDSGIFRYANAGAPNAVAAAHRGTPCYFADDQTVSTSSGAGIFAGIVYDVDAQGVWVVQAFPASEPVAG
jgi:hypothetical protein